MRFRENLLLAQDGSTQLHGVFADGGPARLLTPLFAVGIFAGREIDEGTIPAGAVVRHTRRPSDPCLGECGPEGIQDAWVYISYEGCTQKVLYSALRKALGLPPWTA